MQKFYVDYFDKKYLDFHYPAKPNIPHFQLAYSIGLWAGGDPGESPSEHYQVISTPIDFSALALGMLNYLKTNKDRHELKLSESASKQIQDIEKQVLEEILALHNDFVTPRRT